MAHEGTARVGEAPQGGRPRAMSCGGVGGVAALLGGLVLALACSSNPAEPMNSTSGEPVEVPSWACVPGEAQPCPCPDGLDGLRTCNAEGSGFGECDCSPGAVSQGPPPTSSDTGSGTASDTEATVTGDATMGGVTTGESDPDTSSGAPDPSTSAGTTGGTTSGGSSSSSG